MPETAYVRATHVRANMFQKKPERDRSHSYLGFVRMQPCCLCGDDIHVEAHHPRFNEGMGQKASDYDAVPLCGQHHRELHANGNERAFWASFGIDPRRVALRIQVLVQ